jgi:hypothetical protein
LPFHLYQVRGLERKELIDASLRRPHEVGDERQG